MPLYEFYDDETGARAEVVRPVERRDEPLTITLRRRTVPSRIGVVAGGIPEQTFNDTIKKAYHAREQELGSRFKPQHTVETIKRTLNQP